MSSPAVTEKLLPSTVLQARGVVVAFDGTTVLRDLTLTLARGELVALHGPNGSGKSTTLRTLAGLLSPVAGQIHWRLPRTARLFLPDRPFLHEHLTLREHLRFVAMLHRLPEEATDERVRRLLDRLGLAHVLDAFPGALSRGMKQKFGLLLAFLPPFQVLMLDEPYTALDDQSRETVLELMREKAASGVTCLVTVHEPWEAAAFDRAYRLENGVLREERRCER